MKQAPEIFWDTCVFGAHLYDDAAQYGSVVEHIRQYLREAHEGKWRIITSSILFAELAFSKMKKEAPGSIDDLVADISSFCLVVEPNPNIMMLAGKLRDLPYMKGKSKERRLSVPDAVMLATAVYSRQYCTDFRGFHTFDRGGKRREIPIIGYEEWLDGVTGEKRRIADQVSNMIRCLPEHPTPELPNVQPQPE
jgi:predicted nucleic acid-binding protein